MEGAAGWVETLAGGAGAVAGAYAGGLSVHLKTNVGPEVRIYGGGDGSPGLAQLLGLRAAVVVRDSRGRRVTGYGEYPATDYLRAAALWGAAALIGYLILRGVLRK